jgi:hypothetical protein
MADKKISGLTAASTPLAGTEVLPIVQSGATVKIDVSNLTAGRALSATQFTASTDNFVVATAGKGIDFSANGGDVLTQYDEGTWAVTWTSVTGTPSNTTGYYTRVGRQVFFTYATGAGGLTGVAVTTRFTLPFTPSVNAVGQMISENVNLGDSTLLLTNGRCYPPAFSSAYMVFSGTFNV